MRNSYDSFKSKLLAIKKFLHYVNVYKVYIIIAFIVFMAILFTNLGISGKILEATLKSPNINYGEEINYQSKNIFNKESEYEYKQKDGEWQKGLPTAPGEYELRISTKNGFGQIEYSEPSDISISKKSLKIEYENSNSLKYGDEIKVKADLSFEDQIKQISFTYEVTEDHFILITPISNSVVIINKDNKDVTDCYDVQLPNSITIAKRNLNIKFKDAVKQYDGTTFKHAGYEMLYGSDGLVSGHSLVFEGIDYGKVVGRFNTVSPMVRVVTEDGTDVTNFYNITTRAARITINPIKIKMSTQNQIKDYDGLVFASNENVEYDKSLLVDGEGFDFDFTNVKISQPGSSILNEPIIIPKEGTDINNYDIEKVWGTISINKIDIEISIKNQEFVFDGKYHSPQPEITSGELLDGHELYISYSNDSALRRTITYNSYQVNIYENFNNVSNYYNVKKVPGTITIKPILINVETASSEKKYDRSPLYNHSATCVPVEGYSIPQNFEPEFNFTGSQTEVGESSNTCTIKNNDIFKINEITYGTLKVTKRKLKYELYGTSTEYTGDPIYVEAVYVEGDGFITDDRMQPLQNRTDVGVEDVKAEILIFDGVKRKIADYYDISCEIKEPKLEVTKKKVNIESVDKEVEFNREVQLPNARFEENINGFSIKVIDSERNPINVGEHLDRVTDVQIYKDNIDVTENFEITLNESYVNVIIKKIKIEYSFGEEKEVEFNNKDYLVVENADKIYAHNVLLEGDKISYEYEEKTLFSPGDFASVNVDIIALDKTNQRCNYYEFIYTGNFEQPQAKARIIKRKITIHSNCYQTDDPSEILQARGYEITGELADGHFVKKASYIGIQKGYGRSPSTTLIEEIIDTKTGNLINIEDFYDITYNDGSLTVIKTIEVESMSAEKVYDGYEFAFEYYNKEEVQAQLLEGHRAEVEIIGRQTDLGESINEIGNIVVYDEENVDVSSMYNFNKKQGVLRVVECKEQFRELTKKTNIGTDSQNPISLDGDNLNYGTLSERIQVQLKAESSGRYNLKGNTYSSYNLNGGLEEAEQYINSLASSESIEYLTTEYLMNLGFNTCNVTINNKSSDATYLPFYSVKYSGHIVESSDVKYNQNNNSIYKVEVCIVDWQIDQIRESEKMQQSLLEDYTKFVYENYLYVNDEIKAEVLKFLKDYKIYSTSEDLITRVILAIQEHSQIVSNQTGSYTNSLLKFLKTGQVDRGVEKIALFQILRCLNIPTRIVDVLKFKVNEQDIGNYVDSINDDLVKEVQVFVDNIGWIYIDEPELILNDYLNSNQIVITPKEQIENYTGQLIEPNQLIEEDVYLSTILDKYGYRYEVEIEGASATEPGQYTKTVKSFKLFNNKNVDVTEQYNIRTKEGQMTIVDPTKEKFTIYLLDNTYIYDGKVHSLTLDYVYNYTQYSEKYGKLVLSIEPMPRKECGYFEADEIKPYCSIYSETHGYVNDDFEIEIIGTGLKIVPREITVAAKDLVIIKGQTIDYNECNIIMGSLAKGHRIDCKFSTLSKNKIVDLIIYDENNNDVTGQYLVETIDGDIEIKEEDTIEFEEYN